VGTGYAQHRESAVTLGGILNKQQGENPAVQYSCRPGRVGSQPWRVQVNGRRADRLQYCRSAYHALRRGICQEFKTKVFTGELFLEVL